MKKLWLPLSAFVLSVFVGVWLWRATDLVAQQTMPRHTHASVTTGGPLGAVSLTGDITFDAALAGGADISVATAAANTAGDSLDLVAGAGGTNSAAGVGRSGGIVTIAGAAASAASGANGGGAGGRVTITGGVGSALGSAGSDGAGGNVTATGGAGGGTTDGAGGDILLLGGAATGTGAIGVVRVGTPTIGGTRATNYLAVAGGFEVDGVGRFDGNLTFGDAATDDITVAGAIIGTPAFSLEGATSDNVLTTVALVDPTLARTVTIPDLTGTFILSTASPGAADAVVGVANGFEFEGATGGADANELTLVSADPGADVTVTIPASATTTLAGLAVTQSFTAAQTFTGGITAATTYTCTGACTYDAGGAAGVTIGSADVTALTVTTDGTGTTEVALPAGSIDSTEITDITRSFSVDLGGLVNCSDSLPLDFTAAVDNNPDWALVNSQLIIEYDDTAGSIDADFVCGSFLVPQDAAATAAVTMAVRVTQDAATEANIEDIGCTWSVDGGANAAEVNTALTNQTAVQTQTVTPLGTPGAGAAVAFSCRQSDAAADDIVRIHGIEVRYTATE